LCESIGLEFITALVMRSVIFWDVVTCSLLGDISGKHVGSVFRLEEESKEESNTEHVAGWLCYLFHADLLHYLFCDPENRAYMYL
jgi:hypothetical protein